MVDEVIFKLATTIIVHPRDNVKYSPTLVKVIVSFCLQPKNFAVFSEISAVIIISCIIIILPDIKTLDSAGKSG